MLVFYCVQVVREERLKNADGRATVGLEYCAMNRVVTSDYLEPRSAVPGSGDGYLPMGPPRSDYDSCVTQASYENANHGNRTEAVECETDCSMMGYDVPPPCHIYSEIPANDDDDDDDGEGNHIYESLDQAKPQ